MAKKTKTSKPANKTFTIEVTRTDINKATLDSSKCPVALAVKRAIKKTRGVEVCYTGIYVENRFFVDLPVKATNFITKFDSIPYTNNKKERQAFRSKLKPFSFKIKVPN